MARILEGKPWVVDILRPNKTTRYFLVLSPDLPTALKLAGEFIKPDETFKEISAREHWDFVAVAE